jgi:hypothetical protein
VNKIRLLFSNEKISYFKIFEPVIKFIYLFIKFKADTRATNRYLRKHWSDASESRILLDSIKEISVSYNNFFIYNPTIINLNDELLCFVRVTNLSHKPSTNFWERSRDKNRVTGLLNGIASFSLSNELSIDKFNIVVEPHEVPNFEDPRAFIFEDKLVLFINCIKKYPSASDKKLISQFGYIDLTDKKLTIFESPYKKDIEKNWIPIQIQNRQISFIYESKPLTIYEYNLDSKITNLQILPSRLDFNFHGGTQLIQINTNEFLRIVRYKFRFPKKGLVQISYALIHNENLAVIHTSKPFIFQKFGYETCNGLVLKDGRLIFSWGENDEKIFVGSIELGSFLDWIYSNKLTGKSKFSVYKNIF